MSLPKGILIAVGGAEDKGIEAERADINRLDFFKEGILNRIVELAGKKEEPRIEVVTTASSIPEEVGRIYKKAFKKLGCAYVGHLKIVQREEADQPKVLERLEQANCILFSGGDQLRLCSILGGTQFISRMKERYFQEYFIVAGTSAGAAAMSHTMISGGPDDKAYLKGEVRLSIGFGFMQNVIIDTHFDTRGRFGRLAQAITNQPNELGIGLDEDTGVIVEKGYRLKAIGSSSVVLIDGREITHSNVANIKGGMPISVSNLKVHILSHSDVYDIDKHQFISKSLDFHVK
ncbi:cyanophycinase [Cnuella takakiae]|nr:cyanophycinase [Cnuella takakiae]OLY92865.1 cyanophycinase [Cnuella takakiae]